MLFLVATPIGNLSDISLRAIDTLKSVDVIYCEDTRRSSILMKEYEVHKPLFSYHLFNERQYLEQILGRLRAGEKVALISDAGTPCLNDPGAILVQACVKEGLPFTAIPGACSPIVALLLSGMDAGRFQFVGFLPRKPDEVLRGALGYGGTTVAFESPERLVETLEALAKMDPERQVAVAREMTKTYEECQRGKAGELAEHFRKKGVKGEICLCIAGGKLPAEQMPLDELIVALQELHGVSLKEAIKLAATLTGRPKSEVYKSVHHQ